MMNKDEVQEILKPYGPGKPSQCKQTVAVHPFFQKYEHFQFGLPQANAALR